MSAKKLLMHQVINGMLAFVAAFALVAACNPQSAAAKSLDDIALTARQASIDVWLTWNHADSSVNHYEVYRSAVQPYFERHTSDVRHMSDITPAGLGMRIDYPDYAVLGSSAERLFYGVWAVDNQGQSYRIDGTGGVVLLPLVSGGQATGRVYYVATNGNDANPGSADKPWRTIQKAANTLVAGETVYVRGGTYNEQVKPQKSGTASGGYITYAAYPGETVTIDGSSLTLGLRDGLFWVDSKNYIRVSGFRIINAKGGASTTGIRVEHSSYITISKNYTYNTVSSGIAIWSCSNTVVDGNEVEFANNGGYEENITVDGSNSIEIKNNHVHHGFNSPYGGEAINIKQGSYNVKVYNNRVHDQPKVAFLLDGWMSPDNHDTEFFGNVAYNAPSGFVIESEEGGTVQNVKVYNNIAYNISGAGFRIPNWANNDSSLKKNVQFINNTSYGNGYGILIDSIKVENIVVRNNILSENNVNLQIVSGAQAQTVADHNLFDGAGSPVGSYPVVGDPLFVNPAGAEFHLQSNSPAIDAGSASSAPSTDFDGNPRPQGAGHDLGAYEVR